jgi:predicted nucleic-acid-binding Zn-ribbon protein
VSDRIEKCERCGSESTESGKIMQAGRLWHGVRFRSDYIGFFGSPDPVRAVACRNCGHIELRLALVERIERDPVPLDIRPPHLRTPG